MNRKSKMNDIRLQFVGSLTVFNTRRLSKVMCNASPWKFVGIYFELEQNAGYCIKDTTFKDNSFLVTLLIFYTIYGYFTGFFNIKLGRIIS